MRKYQDNRINESSAEEALLDNLFNFYVDKYGNTSVEETEKHFLNALGSLVDRDEIDERTVKEFLYDKGIEGEIPKAKPKVIYRDREASSGGGCGYSTGHRSGC